MSDEITFDGYHVCSECAAVVGEWSEDKKTHRQWHAGLSHTPAAGLILRKLVAEGHVGAHGDDYWPTLGDCDDHPLDASEMAYLRSLTENEAPPM